MKEGWEVKKLTDVCHIQYGYAFDSSCFCDDDNYPQLIRIRDVVRGYSETFYKGNIPEGYFVYKGDYLIGMDGEFHIAPWQSEKALLNQRVCKISSSDCDVDGRFIYYTMSVVLKQIEDETPFVTVKHLSAKRLNLVKIPIPPLSEQSRIVEELDQLSNIIEKKRQQLSELDNLAQSIFYDMFGDPVTNEKGWEVKKLGEVSNIVGGSTPKTSVEEYWKGEHFWVTPAELKGARYIERTERCISEEAITKTNLTLLPVGTVLLSSRAPIGKVCITKTQMYCNQGFKNVICFDSLNNEYVCQFLMIQKDFLQSLGTGATFKEISKKVTENIDIPLPPLTLQQLFAQKIEAIEKEKELIKQSIKETEELFNSRMDYYFG